ncbi:HET-domain-containing protein [Xylariaceae sp. FL0804]|nr:HET-domain-containing protein [Xylariaceae sp. FL0804]
MDACSVCRNLVALPGLGGGFITGGRGADLEASAPQCRLCSILWEGLSAFCPEAAVRRAAQWITLDQVGDAFRLQYKQSVDERFWRGLNFYTRDAQAPMSDVFKPSSDLEPDTASTRYLEQVKDWVRDCEETHDKCKSRLTRGLPTRVLDVSLHDDFVYLREPSRTDSSAYVALSHVWGGRVPILTTKRTYSAFKDGIPLSDLPKTFRDAVSVARLIHCPYLWIDSLCIIQDSKEDWMREASMMKDVYGNSHITLAAVGSLNSHGGLFHKHELHEIQHVVERSSEAGQPIKVNVRPALEHTSYFESSPYGLLPGATGVLLGRAWCFQEYMLAPRVLMFTNWEILFLCPSHRFCSCGTYRKDMRELFAESVLKARYDIELKSGDKKNIHRLWQDTVKAYSRKDLTYSTDKLPALAGIAQLFDSHLGRYVNGLWEPTLLSDLFWQVDGTFASNYDNIQGMEILEVAQQTGEPGAFAEVSATAMKLRGILTPCAAWCLHGQEASNSRGNHERKLMSIDKQNISWTVDIVSELVCGPENPEDVFVICGTSGPGLVLRRVEGESEMCRRLGIVREPPTSMRGGDASSVVYLI